MWLALASSTVPLRAEPLADPAEPIAVRYQAPEGCPTEAQFLEQLFSRTRRARPAPADPSARLFVVTIETQGTRTAGALEVTNPDGAVTRRTVDGADCSEVASALALIAALTVDPTAATGSVRSDGQMPPVAPAGPAGIPDDRAPAAPPPVVAQEPRLVANDRPATAMPRPEPRVQQPARRNGARWSIGADGETWLGLVPRPAVGGGVFVGVAGSDGSGPSLRLSTLALATNTSLSGSVGARLTWFAENIQACPLGLALSDATRLDTCIAVDVGVLRAKGTGLTHPSVDVKPWIVPGALARLAYVLAPRWAIEAGGGVLVPVHRYPFLYGTQSASTEDAQPYRLPSVAASVTLGAAYLFP